MKTAGVSVFCVFLIAACLFLCLPTSIFGEASDLTHSQRDPRITAVSSTGGLDFANKNDDLLAALQTYRTFWEQVDRQNPPDTDPVQSASGEAIATISDEEFTLICAIVTQEAGDTYDGALAVASCVVNRIAAGNYTGSWEREKHLEDTRAGERDPLAVLTASGQFAAYIDYDYLKYMENVPENVSRAVSDCFVRGVRNHTFLSFRSYPTENSTEIEGNYYFDPFTGDTSGILYDIGTVTSEPEASPDPSGLENWDLLYLICAYDASKKNIEGEVTDADGNPASRFQDLLYGVGEYIVKACFGVEIEVEREHVNEVRYPVYDEKEVYVLRENQIEKERVYVKSGESSTKIKIDVPVYTPVEVAEVEGFEETDEEIEILEDKIRIPEKEREYPIVSHTDYFIKSEERETLEPTVETVKEKRKVRGLQKSVLLNVLGLEPGEPYAVLNNPDVTNSDFIEYSRKLLITVLDLDEKDYAFSGSTILPVGSATGWVWPLDPNGANVYMITSLMGTRESPGGIGSTNHGGTDIGASMGVAILAVDTGTVEIAGVYGGYGNCVKIRHDPTATGDTYETIYGHMSRIASTVGQRVEKGQVIGYVGSTGWSTGPHLHFEVHKNGEKINGLSMYDDTILSKLVYP